MGNFTRYNAKDCTVSINDIFVTQLAEEMVTGAKDEEFFSTSVGAQGDVVRSDINNDLGTVTITVQATCPQMAQLMALQKATEPFSVWVTNNVLGRRFGGTKANLKKPPEIAMGTEAGDVSFEFQVFDYVAQ